MTVVERFGKIVDQTCDRDPAKGRQVLRAGWEAQLFMFRHRPVKALMPGYQYLAALMMDTMLEPLRDPAHSAIVSIFTPCQLLQEVGLAPYNAEAFSAYLQGSKCQQSCIQNAEASGLPETLCSYHKIFTGAAEKGLLPKPRCIVYTNLTCDANLVTFRRLASFYKVPSFFIDVPRTQGEAEVRAVADQLRELAVFLEKITGKKIHTASLKRRTDRAVDTMSKFRKSRQLQKDHYIPTDLVSPQYGAMVNNVLLGTREVEHFSDLLLKDARSSAPARGVRLYWIHTNPYWSGALRKILYINERVQIIGSDMEQVITPEEMASEDPYVAMARQMVYNHHNGPVERRIRAGISQARESGCDGVVWFNHWGCKHTIGGSALAKKRFEEAGLPYLVLDGDGVDPAHGGEGQTATRMGAFVEMLEKRKEQQEH